MRTPLLSPAEAQSHDTFVALMWALTHPGQIQTWTQDDVSTSDSFQAIGQALLDLETGFYTPDTALADGLVRTTARPLPANAARYHFYPSLSADNLDDIAQASVGTMLYPDKGTTIIIGCTLSQGSRFRLTGPGIKTETMAQMEGILPELWKLRQERLNYPLGWDLFLVDGKNVMGLPRTTELETGD